MEEAILIFALVGAPTFTIVYDIPKIVNLARRTKELHYLTNDMNPVSWT